MISATAPKNPQQQQQQKLFFLALWNTFSHSFMATFQFSKPYLTEGFNLRKESLIHLLGKVKASKMLNTIWFCLLHPCFLWAIVMSQHWAGQWLHCSSPFLWAHNSLQLRQIKWQQNPPGEPDVFSTNRQLASLLKEIHCSDRTIKDLSKWSGAKDKLTHGFQCKSIISMVSHNKADIQRKTVVGYLEETMETKDDLGSRVLKKPLSLLESNFHRKETCIYFSAHS